MSQGYKRATPAIQNPVRQPEPDDKWGRHRCRPHSHRCVAEFLQHECSRDTDLASDVSPSGHSKMVFRFLHRRSHRHPDLPSARPGFGRVAIRGSLACLAQPRFNGRFRSLAFHWWPAPRTITSRSGPRTFARRHLRQPTGMARPATRNLRPSVIDPPCVRPKALARGSRKARGQNPLRLPGFRKFLPFRSLDHLGERLSWPFR